jgi:DNA-binding SARP family transcriptional activator/tetratricopeptide (TPR) repeat protein
MENHHLTTTMNPASSMRLDVHLLGRFVVFVDHAEIPTKRWPSLRATQLVQLLSLAPRHRLTREQAIDALWSELAPEAGAANLRKAVHHARQALGRHDSVLLQGGELRLWPDGDVTIDSENFEVQARDALILREPLKCKMVADLYAGELLPSARYEAWAEPARERLHACFTDLLRASAQWERLAQVEPGDEPTHRALMTAELAAGNRAAAIRWYAHLREALQRDFGVLPDLQTEAVYQRCIAGLQPVRAAFIGRGMLLAQALAWLEMPVTDRPGAIVLRGSAGIGKTALCRELELQSARRGWTVIRANAAQHGRAYAVISVLVERVLLAERGALDRVGVPARAALAALSQLAGPASSLTTPLSRHQVIGAFRRLLLVMSHDGNILVQVDDAHLIDDADADVLMHLASAGAPVCVVLVMRAPVLASELDRGLLRLAASNVVRTLDLEPLVDEEMRRLIQQSAPKNLTEEVVAQIVSDAQGSPFAAIELARGAGIDQRLHRTAADAITARLCDVPTATFDALKWMALAGDAFDAQTAAAVLPDIETRAYAVLDAALAAGVLVLDGSQYRFRHDLVRQALVDQIAPHRRLKIHRQAAQRLAELDAAPALIAQHWIDGGSLRESVPWLLAAASDAVRVAAFSDALRHLEPLLRFQPAQADALRLRAEALDAMGNPAAVAAYRLAAEAAGEPAAQNLRAKGALAQIKQGDPKGALQALEGLRPTSVEGRLCEALAYSGAAALGAADPAMGTQKSAEARRLALDTGDTATLVVASWAQAAAAHARGELHRSIWADLQETAHVPHLAMRVFDGQLCIAQRFLYGARPYSEVIDFAKSLADEAQRIGAARGYAFGITIRGEAELLSGDLLAAEEHLTQGAKLHRAIGGSTGEAFSLQRLSEVAIYQGKHSDARALLDDALDVARQTDVGFHLLDRIYGTYLQLADSPTSALRALEEARAAVHGPLETCPGCRITFTVPAAIAAARAGQLDLAEDYASQTSYLANVVMRLPAWHAAHDEVRGHISLAKGEDAMTAHSKFSAAAARFRIAGQPLDSARCDHLAANALLVSDGKSDF